MKQIYLILVLVLSLVSHVEAQSSKEDKKAQKAAKKAAKLAEQTARMEPANELLRNKRWVVEVTQAKATKGRMANNLDPSRNFVSCVGEDGTVQLSFNGIVGFNGIGGVTLDGKYSTYKVKEPTKPGQGVILEANITGSGGFARMTVLVQSSQVEVRISGSWGERISLFGTIYAPEDSKVFKGMRSN